MKCKYILPSIWSSCSSLRDTFLNVSSHEASRCTVHADLSQTFFQGAFQDACFKQDITCLSPSLEITSVPIGWTILVLNRKCLISFCFFNHIGSFSSITCFTEGLSKDWIAFWLTTISNYKKSLEQQSTVTARHRRPLPITTLIVEFFTSVVEMKTTQAPTYFLVFAWWSCLPISTYISYTYTNQSFFQINIIPTFPSSS